MSDFIAGDKRTISPSDKTGFSVTAVDNGQTLIVTESSKGDAQQQWNIQLINADSPSDGYKIQSAIADTYLATDTETNKLTQSKEPYTWFITPSDTNPRTIQCSSTNLFWNYDPNSIEQEVFLSGVPDPGQSGSGWQIDFSITPESVPMRFITYRKNKSRIMHCEASSYLRNATNLYITLLVIRSSSPLGRNTGSRYSVNK